MNKSVKNKIAALLMVGVMSIPMAGFANELEKPLLEAEVMMNQGVLISEKEQKENDYINYVGQIKEVNKYNDRISLLVTNDDDEYGMVFHISDKVLIWDGATGELVGADNFKEGMTIDVYFPKLTPMTASLPPQLTPSVIVIRDETAHGSTYMGEFNQDLTSTDNYLKLNIGEDTIIVNQKGQSLTQEDIYNRVALVFYGASTKSIPAQTTPSKIVVMSKNDEVGVDEPEVDEPIEEEKEEAMGMIPLREKATELGYKVQWNEDGSVELTKQNQTITLKLGQVDYTLNKSLGKFSKAPELRDGVLYVQESILEIMQ